MGKKNRIGPIVKDLTGQKFDRLTVLSIAGKTSYNSTLWRCRCDCGKEITAIGKTIKNGKRTSCGCKRKEFGKRALIDMTGRVYGHIAVLNRITKENGLHAWVCNCDCGNKFLADGHQLRLGKTTHCGCRRGEKQIRALSGFKSLYAQYRSRAKTNNYPFTLSEASFALLTSSNCYYCGTPPIRVRTSAANHSPYSFNGIDRVDSNCGYELWNCVPSCKECNIAKMAMKSEEFHAWLDRVSVYHQSQFAEIDAIGEIISQCA